MADKPTLNPKNQVERKRVTLTDVKLNEEQGAFEGYASVWNVTDLQNDVVKQGAFKRTIENNAGLFLLLDQHQVDREIGLVKAREDDHGLFVEGQFHIDPNGDTTKDVDGARSVYNKMRYRHDAGKPLQFSIGYRAINPTFERGVRVLSEIGLAEVSAVTYPALPEAVTTAVKTTDDLSKAFGDDYARALQQEMPWLALDIARTVVMGSIFDAIFGNADQDERLEQLNMDLSDFHQAVVQNVQALMSLDEESLTLARAHLEPHLKESTGTAEPDPTDGHSEDAPAGEGGDPHARALADLTDRMRKGMHEPTPSLTPEVRRLARKMRECINQEAMNA